MQAGGELDTAEGPLLTFRGSNTREVTYTYVYVFVNVVLVPL